jgi:ketosteroid isomerase-like protein
MNSVWHRLSLARGLGVIALCISLSLCSVSWAKNSPKEVHNKRLVQTAFDRWKSGTGSPFDLLAASASWTIEGNSLVSKTYVSKEDFLRSVIRPFNARMAGHLTPSIHGIYADNKTVIIHFDADGVARDGKPYHNTYVWIFEIEHDLVVRAVAMFDSLEFNDLWTRVQPRPDQDGH